MAEAQNEKKLLVKSSGVVIGPFRFDEIVEQLKSKKIALIDEVRSPNERWTFIREHRDFLKIIQKIREEIHSLRDESSLTNSVTITDTAKIDNFVMDVVEDSQPKLVQGAIESLSHSKRRKSDPGSTFTYDLDEKIKPKLKESGRRASVIAWSVFGLMIVGFAVTKLSGLWGSAHYSFDDYINLAKSNLASGQYERALDFYHKAESIKSIPPTVRLQFIPFLMSLENQNIQSRQVLEQLKENLADEVSQKEISELLALSYLREGQLSEAETKYRELAQGKEANNSIKLNLIEVLLLQEKYSEAQKVIVENQNSQGLVEPLLWYYKAISVYKQSNSIAVADSVISESVSDLTRFIQTTPEKKAEALLILTVLQKKMGRYLDVAQTLKDLLNTSPELSLNHLRNPKVHEEIFDWGYLRLICQDLQKDVAPSPLFMGAAAYCSYQQNDLKTALDIMDTARKQYSSESVLLGLQGFLLKKVNRSEEAIVLNELPGATANLLLMEVRAQICLEKNDFECSEKVWNQVLAADEKNLEAISGLAQLKLLEGDKNSAQELINRGLAASPKYKPLLLQKDQLHDR